MSLRRSSWPVASAARREASAHCPDRPRLRTRSTAAINRMFGPDNVRVNCIAPGLIRTDFAKALWEDPEILERSTKGVPLRRIGEPDELAGAAVYLASKAGSFMTGQALVVDGGATI